MKTFLISILLCYSFVSVAQITPDEVEVKTYKTHAYIKGIRLDSIDAIYAYLYKNGSNYHLDYGQDIRRTKDMILVSEKGLYLVFKNNNYERDLTALNLLYFNGWELIESISFANDHPRYYLKKKEVK